MQATRVQLAPSNRRHEPPGPMQGGAPSHTQPRTATEQSLRLESPFIPMASVSRKYAGQQLAHKGPSTASVLAQLQHQLPAATAATATWLLERWCMQLFGPSTDAAAIPIAALLMPAHMQAWLKHLGTLLVQVGPRSLSVPSAAGYVSALVAVLQLPVVQAAVGSCSLQLMVQELAQSAVYKAAAGSIAAAPAHLGLHHAASVAAAGSEPLPANASPQDSKRAAAAAPCKAVVVRPAKQQPCDQHIMADPSRRLPATDADMRTPTAEALACNRLYSAHEQQEQPGVPVLTLAAVLQLMQQRLPPAEAEAVVHFLTLWAELACDSTPDELSVDEVLQQFSDFLQHIQDSNPHSPKLLHLRHAMASGAGPCCAAAILHILQQQEVQAVMGQQFVQELQQSICAMLEQFSSSDQGQAAAAPHPAAQYQMYTDARLSLSAATGRGAAPSDVPFSSPVSKQDSLQDIDAAVLRLDEAVATLLSNRGTTATQPAAPATATHSGTAQRQAPQQFTALKAQPYHMPGTGASKVIDAPAAGGFDFSLADLHGTLKQQYSMTALQASTQLEPLLCLAQLVKGQDADPASTSVPELLRHTDILLHFYKQQAQSAAAITIANTRSTAAATAAVQVQQLLRLLQLPTVQQQFSSNASWQEVLKAVQAAHAGLCADKKSASAHPVAPVHVVRHPAQKSPTGAQDRAGRRHMPETAANSTGGVSPVALARNAGRVQMALQPHQDGSSARAAAVRKRKMSVEAVEAAEVGEWLMDRPVRARKQQSAVRAAAAPHASAGTKQAGPSASTTAFESAQPQSPALASSGLHMAGLLPVDAEMTPASGSTPAASISSSAGRHDSVALMSPTAHSAPAAAAAAAAATQRPSVYCDPAQQMGYLQQSSPSLGLSQGSAVSTGSHLDSPVLSSTPLSHQQLQSAGGSGEFLRLVPLVAVPVSTMVLPGSSGVNYSDSSSMYQNLQRSRLAPQMAASKQGTQQPAPQAGYSVPAPGTVLPVPSSGNHSGGNSSQASLRSRLANMTRSELFATFAAAAAQVPASDQHVVCALLSRCTQNTVAGAPGATLPVTPAAAQAQPAVPAAAPQSPAPSDTTWQVPPSSQGAASTSTEEQPRFQYSVWRHKHAAAAKGVHKDHPVSAAAAPCSSNRGGPSRSVSMVAAVGRRLAAVRQAAGVTQHSGQAQDPQFDTA